MSLTSFLGQPHIKKYFRENIKKPDFRIKKDITARPKTKNYSLVGTAFDYLLRFYIKANNPNAIETSWIAEGLSGFDERYDEILREAKLKYKKYLRTKTITEDIIIICINLAKIDVICRCGKVPRGLKTCNKKDIDDLRSLISIFIKSGIIFDKKVSLNPSFNKIPIAIGGADADIITEDAIIEIKTTKKLELKRDSFNQLVGYYLLSKIGGVNPRSSRKKIKKIGVYFSRFGVLHMIDIKSFMTREDETNFMNFIMTNRGQIS